MSTCGSCKARIFWAHTTAGKSMPIDAVQDPEGLVTIRREVGQVSPLATVWSKTNPPPADQARYTSHFATCPNRAQHRKPR